MSSHKKDLQFKYVLTADQIKVLTDAHKKIMEHGLLRLGFDYSEHGKFMDVGVKTFDSILQETQRVLKEKGEREQSSLEIKRDIKNLNQ